MHINAIRAFINDHPIVIDEQLTTSGINRKIVKPETEGISKPYIDTLANTNDPQTVIPYVSAATVFVSHAWKYRFYDVVVKCMEQHAVTNPNATFCLTCLHTIRIQWQIKNLNGLAQLNRN